MNRKPKNAAKENEKSTKKATSNASTNGTSKSKGGRPGRKSGRAGKPKKKTAAELDAEMVDYFGNDANGTAQPAATNGGDTAVVDEVM